MAGARSWDGLLPGSMLAMQIVPDTKAGQKLQRIIKRFLQTLFVFVTNRDIPPTNNGSEQALRPCVVFRKVTNCFRSQWGAQLYANVRSVVETARRRSIGALQAVPTAAVYCGSKFAVRAISDGLRQESGRIRVACVNPGVVETDLAATITHPGTRALMDDYRAIALQPTDIARAVRQLIEAPARVDTTEITIRPTASAN